MAGVGHAPVLVRFAHHRHTVHQRVVAGRTQLGLTTRLHQRRINGRRQLTTQPIRGAALGVVGNELQHHIHRQGQGNGLSQPELVPARPIPHGALVAAHGVGGFTFAQQLFEGVKRAVAQQAQALFLFRRCQQVCVAHM